MGVLWSSWQTVDFQTSRHSGNSVRGHLTMMSRCRWLIAAVVLAVVPVVANAEPAAANAEPFVLVVMDPLSKPLSCDCVRGYAQREYKLLAKHLEQSLGREDKVVWYESLAEATKCWTLRSTEDATTVALTVCLGTSRSISTARFPHSSGVTHT